LKISKPQLFEFQHVSTISNLQQYYICTSTTYSIYIHVSIPKIICFGIRNQKCAYKMIIVKKVVILTNDETLWAADQ